MLFLRARGSVLYYDHVPTLRDRVFIRPQWLVDVIKELVRHDLREQLELLDPRFDSIETTRQLAQEFLDTGVVKRACYRGSGVSWTRPSGKTQRS